MISLYSTIFVYYNDDTFTEIARSVHYKLDKIMKDKDQVIERRIPVILTNRIDIKDANEDNLFIMLGLNNEIPLLPPKYVAYQFEQTGNANSWFTESYLSKLQSALEIWDYSIVNIQYLRKAYPDLPIIRYVPLGFSPTLCQIKNRAEKMYDILFYGSANPRRDQIIRNLRNAGFRVYYGEFSCWNEDRNRLIADSKIVLNLHYYPNPVLETSRITFLLANSAFVISEPSLDPILDKEYNNYVVFSDSKNLIETCRYYLDHPNLREEFATQAHLKFIQKEFTIPTNLFIPTPTQPQQPPTQPQQNPTQNPTQPQQNTRQPQQNPTQPQQNPTQPQQNPIKPQQNPINLNKNQPNSLLRDVSPNILNKGKIRPKFYPAEVEITVEGDAKLKFDNLMTSENCPTVTLVTPTANRGWSLTSLAIRNFYRFDYPRDKLEWVIIDSQSSGIPLNLPQDPRIKYYLVDNATPLWVKRNMCNEKASGEIIIHLDDDDFYFPSSIWTKVKLLDKYQRSSNPLLKAIQCVGCTQLGIYHLLDNYSYLADTKYISEASMAYTRAFWQIRPFTGENLEMGEGYAFIDGRDGQVSTIPYYFNLIALTHNQNYTGKLRTHKDTTGKKHDNFFNLWDKETQYFFLELKIKALNAKLK
ncbi:MAG: glycosyltransferase [Candidatus Paceibacterota bacterium]